MKKKYQNLFFIFGLAVLIIMVSQLNFKEVIAGISNAGYWFFAVVLLWVFLYMLNTAAWWIIIQSTAKPAGTTTVTTVAPPVSNKLPSAQSEQDECTQTLLPDGRLRLNLRNMTWIYCLTVSGFALNYATPGGLMGGEPYRIMSLKPVIGIERATSSVVLYSMTHIFSHFWFWLLSIFLFLIIHRPTAAEVVMLAAIAAFCFLGLWFFFVGYRKGLAAKLLRAARHLPGLHKKMSSFINSHETQINTIDSQISALHRQNTKTFVTAVLLEILCRIASALEIFFILKVIMPHVCYADCLLILAFTSFIANLLFFIPLQMGGRESGFLMSATGLSMSTNAGILVALIVRLRELIWVAVGLLLIKVSGRNATPANQHK